MKFEEHLKRLGHDVTEIKGHKGFAPRCWCRNCGVILYWYEVNGGIEYYRSNRGFLSFEEALEYHERTIKGGGFYGHKVELSCADIIIKDIIE